MIGRTFSFILFLAAVGGAYALDHYVGREAAFTLWIGVALGLVLQRSRFCFFCNLREALEEREPRPVAAILLALAVATLGAVTIFSIWIPDASAGYLPQRGHLSPAAWPMLAGGLVFGLGMAFSGSCISAHLYRLAEGSSLSLVALATALLGFSLGDLFWNPLYLSSYRTAEVIWLPRYLGFGGAVAAQLVVLGLLGLWVWKRQRTTSPEEPSEDSVSDAIFVHRWPWWVGGTAVGVIASVALLRTQPLGVTAELSRLGHALALAGGWSPERLEGLEGLRGCIITTPTAFLSQNAILLLGLVGGSLIASLAGGHFEWVKPKWSRAIGAAAGGILLGVGARMALGCTIGTLLGGISALSLSGWVFAVGVVGGVFAGLGIRRRIPWGD